VYKRQEISNIDSRDDITVTIDGNTDNSFQFDVATNKITSKYNLEPGTHVILVSAKTDCGQDTEKVEFIVEKPCNSPVLSFGISGTNVGDYTHQLIGNASNIDNRNKITLKHNGNTNNGFQFNAGTGKISDNYNLEPGSHAFIITVKNECGEDTRTVNINVESPCNVPEINCTISDSDEFIYTTELSGTITNTVKNDISIRIDNMPYSIFDFDASTGIIFDEYNLVPGNHTMIITAENECGEDSETFNFTVASPCIPPVVFLSVTESSSASFTHSLQSTVTNCERSEITVLIDGTPDDSFVFEANMNRVTAEYNFNPGTHTMTVKAENACGEDAKGTRVSVVEQGPCDAPTIDLSIEESSSNIYTHQLSAHIANVDRSDITITVDGNIDNSFNFNTNSNTATDNYNFSPGTHSVVLTATNECGSDSEAKNIIVEEPCEDPIISFSLTESSSSLYTHRLTGTIENVNGNNEITVTVDGVRSNSYQYNQSSNSISANYNFNPGTHTVKITLKNDCGNDSQTKQVKVAQPCVAPTVNFTVTKSNKKSATHQLNGTVTNITNKNNISVKVNGSTNNNFQFTSSTGKISATFDLDAGTHTILVSVTNECGNDSHSAQVTIEEEACGPRFNPGNAEWEFCLVTPSGTYNRSDLNDDFSYSGSATSLYFKATSGGGDAIINGSPYSISSGRYYLFGGNLQVKVSTSNPGSMGQWSVCVETNKAPKSGVGNSRPISPCEATNDKDGDSDSKIKDRPGKGTNIDVNNSKGRTGGSSTNTGSRNTNSTKGRTGNVNTSGSPKTPGRRSN